MTSFNGALVEALTAGRNAHARLCLDVASVTRVSNGALNRTTHAYTTTPTTIYTGQARLKRATPQDQALDDRAVEATRLVLDLPWIVTGASSLLTGDSVAIVSQDAGLTARTFTVVAPALGTTNTAHRYLVEEVDR